MIDTVVSVATPVLDAFVSVELRSTVQSSDVLALSASALGQNSDWIPVDPAGADALPPATCCVLFRSRGTGVSYAEMVHPSDLAASRLSGGSAAEHAVLQHRLFSCSLEKGVVLRARLRGVFLPRVADCSAAAAEFARFVSADPPLGR